MRKIDLHHEIGPFWIQTGGFETTQVVVARFTTGVVAVSMLSRNRSQSTQRAEHSPAKDDRHDIHGMVEGRRDQKKRNDDEVRQEVIMSRMD